MKILTIGNIVYYTGVNESMARKLSTSSGQVVEAGSITLQSMPSDTERAWLFNIRLRDDSFLNLTTDEKVIFINGG